ncbi:toll/interleukin-1 receptor domain-containing protein [Pectobacterium carotovorum]|uniref:toll/interleukin-1 receptor domain-containing protein n=1 Tax=Pectobacterium carotovorum TaxID=554 RepID=UPI001CC21D73|nr:toll/interleukin-1 receptor domain-containing protein [Pectobacterium carotovorum]UCZ81072.1 toll/interleukin-1 receptor domain-containing protein [Pectobacterium carotovorum]
MRLEDFLRNSVLPEIQVASLYFKPNIPKNKLFNAIQGYAPNVGISTVVALLDESIWGSGKEGMIITNDDIILSKRLGGHIISLTLVNQIHIDNKNLIVNDLPVAKFSNPEVLPLAAFGEKLNEFVIATKKAGCRVESSTALDDSIVEKLNSFLVCITEPIYFSSAPIERRKPGAVTINYELGASISEEQRRLIRFKGNFAANEDILSVSWLDGHNCKDYFFCITNYGVYSIRPGSSVVFISHDDLRNLDVIEEYEESRYIGVRLSNDQEIIVLVRNIFIRPYAYKLFIGLINILKKYKSSNQRHSQVEINKISNSTISVKDMMTLQNAIKYDLFISHASEDKDKFVRPLAKALESLGVKVWYDEFTLKVGDSLRKSIDQGLVNSRFGTVILSSAFCSKNWTQYEFDSMVAKEMNGHKMILPVWHNITKDEVINFSPALADKVALNSSSQSIEYIAEQLAVVILSEKESVPNS